MSEEKSPAFQFYPKDFLADTNVVLMDADEVGMYIFLMSACWIEESLPNNEKDLAKIARVTPKKFKKSWESRIQKCFTKNKNGEWIHPRLEKERQKQREYKNKKVAAGRKGAEKRWSDDSIAKNINNEEHGSAIAMPENKNSSAIDLPVAKNSSSSSSATSSPNKKNPSGSKRKTFKPPSLDEVHDYLVEEKGYPTALAKTVSEMFWSSYEMKDWKVGKAKMSDWKIALGRAISDNESGWETIKREKEKYYGKAKTAQRNGSNFDTEYRKQLEESIKPI